MKKIILFLLLLNIYYQFDINKKTLRVIVIEINPILSSIANKKLYKNNNGILMYLNIFSKKEKDQLLKW